MAFEIGKYCGGQFEKNDVKVVEHVALVFA